MLRSLPLILICLVLSVSFASAADLQVAAGQITTAIEKQMPVDRIESYPADYGKLYCFTRVVGADQNTKVTHVWYYQENEMARVDLAVKSADWRTYSSKRFLPQWVGQWHVRVLDESGQEIASIPFVLE